MTDIEILIALPWVLCADRQDRRGQGHQRLLALLALGAVIVGYASCRGERKTRCDGATSCEGP